MLGAYGFRRCLCGLNLVADVVEVVGRGGIGICRWATPRVGCWLSLGKLVVMIGGHRARVWFHGRGVGD